ncbi:peptidase M20 domain-containing protein 2 [Rhipicephalus sanguineus]|uniref:Peptidase M20 domain-containing protein 2 n=1 Tax=Rhipicephalus sanguineus TaxID=34632 RepID=A0A9D4QC95_RHISA|nr:peptidase M20 domain-containing protein 2 [Rhipicephalus sanguineus]KAH7972579.1 hypothetical protein HPB52_013632 [Rhipicephalus sanguineus]
MAVDLKDLVNEVVEANSEDLYELSRFVWGHPELALKEVQCHDWLTDFLERRGFEVTRNYLLDTAFKAEFHAPGGAEGPCIALLCEFDALPDIGHACGHNLIAEASVGAALAVQEAMKSNSDMRGKLVVLGTPAEESRCGKEQLIRMGALNGIDATLMAHPSPVDILAAAFVALHQIVVRFKGKAAHAGGSPWEGINALDAAVASYVNIGLLRQQLRPTARVHGVITDGGKYPNVIPEASEAIYFVRAPSTEELAEVKRKVKACFHAAAEATGCTVEIEEQSLPYMHMIHNDAMARTYRKHANALGVTFVDDVVENMPPSGAGTDCGNVSHRVPTIHPVFGIGSARGPANHTRGFADVANAADSQPPTLRAAKVLALTALDLLTDSELMGEVKREFAALQLPPEEEMRAMLS